MPASPSLPWFELARFQRSRVTRTAILAVTIVPLLFAGLYIWANLDPTGNVDQIDAAIVNNDEVVETQGPDGETQPVAIGRLLAGNLISDDSDDNYDWQLTDARDAAAGLADGRYKAVLTIPENLSAAATSTSGDPADVLQGRIELTTNDAVNYVNGAIAERILDAARDSLNAQVTETYLDNIYLAFSDIRLALGDAADGAGELGDGAAALADGTGQLADGANQLLSGANQLAGGIGQLNSGAQQLDGGLSRLDRETAPLASATRQLADGAEQVAGGTAQLNETVRAATGIILDATEDADANIDALAAELNRLADECEDAATPGIDCSAIRDIANRADDAKDFVAQARGQVDEVRTSSQQLADGAQQVADGNAELARNVPSLVDGIGQAASGASRLADGTAQLAASTGEAVAGAQALATGLGEAADGADDLAAGAYQLQSGLNDGQDEVPDYTDDQRDVLAETAATPIEDAADRANEVGNYGAAMAPYFMALALWVGAMAIYLLLRPFSARAIASTAGSIRIALAGFAPGLALASIQAAFLVVLVDGVLGLDVSRTVLFVATALMGALTFVALNQMFVALFGAVGRFVSLAFISLQVAAAGATYPIEASNGFFATVHQLMPLTFVIDLFRAAIAGGPASVGQGFTVLAVYSLGALAVTAFAAYRKQNVTMQQLHPTLVV